MNGSESISWSIRNNIGFVELSNPPANQMTPGFFRRMTELTGEIIPCSNVRAIIISGSGRHFSSGADLNSLLSSINHQPDKKSVPEQTLMINTLSDNLESFSYFRELNIPVIAAIRGICLGSALELAMFCHFRVCAEGSVLGLPESTFGLMPGIGGIQNLHRQSGKAKTIELALRGNTLSADEALKYEIVDKVAYKKDLLPFSISFAEKVSLNYRKYKKAEYLKELK